MEILLGFVIGEGVVIIGLAIALIVALRKGRAPKGKADNVYVKDGERYTRDRAEFTADGDVAVTHREGDVLLERGVTYTVGKASAGALEYVPVARVANLPSCMEELKRRGVWIFGADMDGTPWCEADFTGPMALVIGSEGFGMGRLVKEKCDFIISLPMKGKITSLNASVACGVLAYEAARQRAGIRAR